MSRVFVPNQPTTRDPATREVVPKVDLTRAGDFGPLVFLTPDGLLRMTQGEIVAHISRGLEDYTADDYLLLVGDPRAMAIAAAIAADRADGRLKMLQWDRRDECYRVISVQLWEADGAQQQEYDLEEEA